MGKCRECGQNIAVSDLRVSIHGMYDCHAFCKFEGATIDEVIENWKEHSRSSPYVEKYGPTSLCPIIVTGTNQATGVKFEIRRVGKMVMDSSEKYAGDLEEWRNAAFADPDIAKILADSAAKVG